MIKLSILIPTVHTRRDTFSPKIIDKIYGLYDKLNDFQKEIVEILVLMDNKKSMLGEKRNNMISMCKGEYIQFIDDDDRIEDDFITSLLEGISSDADVITFDVSVSLNGQTPKICQYSKDFKKDYNTNDGYFRIPNHICCVKKSVSLNSSFPNISYGEDSSYSKILLPHIKTEHRIKKVLYHYDYNKNTTETQPKMVARREIKNISEPIIDVIILSNAKSDYLRTLTERTIYTLKCSVNGLSINIIVIEQSDVTYEGVITIHNPDKFNYNRFANQGISMGSAEWVMVANSDLVFHDGFLHNLLSANHLVVSPKEPNDKRQSGITENTIGDINGTHFSGWCFAMKRSVWKEIDGLDESVEFWMSDDATIEQIKKIGIQPMIVASSIVEHLGSSTLKTLTKQEIEEKTWGQVESFNRKYKKNKFNDSKKYRSWKARYRK